MSDITHDLVIEATFGDYRTVATIPAAELGEDASPALAGRLITINLAIMSLLRRAGLRPREDARVAAISVLSAAIERGADDAEIGRLERELMDLAGIAPAPTAAI